MKKFFILFILLLNCGFSFGATLDEMIGQMILVGFKGEDAQSREYKIIKRQIKKGEIGGVILFDFNIRNEEQLKKLTSDLNNIESEFKPFISVDQEGGKIERLKDGNGFKSHIGAFDAAKKLSLNKTFLEYDDMAKMLHNNGFNLNFAPVVDLALNSDSIVIQKGRAYSSNPIITSDYAKQFILANDKNNIISTLKHFPGHGSPSGDTHKGFVDGSRTWSDIELIPYKRLMGDSKLLMIMTSHIFIDKFDSEYPSSLSRNITEGILRKELGYNGVIITDDLYMGAVSNNYSLKEIVVNAINAGNDILLFSNYDSSDMRLPKKIKRIVKREIKRGNIKNERINESYKRITGLKKELQKRNPNN